MTATYAKEKLRLTGLFVVINKLLVGTLALIVMNMRKKVVLDESVEIKINASSKDSPSDSEESQQSMKCLLVSSGMKDNSEVKCHVEPLNKILTTSRGSCESLPSADDTSDDTR